MNNFAIAAACNRIKRNADDLGRNNFAVAVARNRIKYNADEYRESAEQGNADAQYMLGECYYYGAGVEVNHKEAVKWYQKAAEQGNADAQYILGMCYDNGKGVEVNHKEAVKWYQKAAEQGISKKLKSSMN